MQLNPWPKVSRYRNGKGRPLAVSPRRGAATLPPLASLEAPLMTINGNSDPAALVIERTRADRKDHRRAGPADDCGGAPSLDGFDPDG